MGKVRTSTTNPVLSGPALTRASFLEAHGEGPMGVRSHWHPSPWHTSDNDNAGKQANRNADCGFRGPD